MNSLLAFRSPGVRGVTRRARTSGKSNKNRNIYVPSTTEAPELNRNYLAERNFNVRKGLNNMLLRSAMRPNQLTNSQIAARREVAMMMARGEHVPIGKKIEAGMKVTFPKPTMPKPASMASPSAGGKRKTRKTRKASRRRRMTRRR